MSSCSSSAKKDKKVRSSELGARSSAPPVTANPRHRREGVRAPSRPHAKGDWVPGQKGGGAASGVGNNGLRHGDNARRQRRDGKDRRPKTEDRRQKSSRAADNSESRIPTSEFLARIRAEREATLALHAQWVPESFAVEPQEGKKRCHDFALPGEILPAIHDLGFRYCPPIQAGSLEKAMAGENVAGRAQTGTGKTAAFLVAILTRYLRTQDSRNEKTATPRALVIAPTRELCIQICEDAKALGKYCNLRSVAVYGGIDYSKQQLLLQDDIVDLLVATPGRLIDFARQHAVDLSKIDTLVIDEADRMLDMGFIPDVRRIIRMLPKERQTLLYSATLNNGVMLLAAQWMPSPVKVEIEPEKTANANIDQKVYIVTSEQKFTILCNLLRQHKGERVLVFGNRRSSTDLLAERLRRAGFPCDLLSGDVAQGVRMRVIDDFKSGKTKLVVATDVAGRGLHIADIGLVVNFELPYVAEDYVHRIGRTGRAGQVGTAVSFADEDESFAIPDIEEYLGETLKTTMLYDDDPLLAR